MPDWLYVVTVHAMEHVNIEFTTRGNEEVPIGSYHQSMPRIFYHIKLTDQQNLTFRASVYDLIPSPSRSILQPFACLPVLDLFPIYV